MHGDDDRRARFEALFAAHHAAVRSYIVRRAGGIGVDDGPVVSRSRSTRRFHPIRGTAAVTPVAPRPYRYELPIGTPTRLDALQPDAIAVAGRDLWVANYASGDLLHFRIVAG